MANVWMTRDEMIADSSLLPAEFNAQYLDGNGEMVDCVYTKNDVRQDRVGVSDTTCDMSWWASGDGYSANRFVAQYLATNITNLPQSASNRRISIDIPVYMRNVKYLDICFCVWIDLGYARDASLSSYNSVSYANYVRDKHLLKLYCIPTPGNDHPGTGRLSIQGSPGFVPFRFLYDDEENPINIDFLSLQFAGGYSEQNQLNVWISQPCYNEDIEYDGKPQPIPQEINQGPVTPARAGGEGTFTSMSNNDGDRTGTSLLSAISTANDTFKTVLGDAFNIYEVNDSDLSKVINVLYGSDYFTRFENTMFNPLSAIISCALLPEIFVASPAPLHDMLAGGYNISQHIWPNPVTFKSPEPLIVRHIGDISLNKYFDGYADFDPYTKAKLHLPYIGEIAIDINKIAHGELAVEYVCDVLSGNVAAWVWCNDIDGNHQYCYTATGNCAYNIPLFSATADGSAIGKIIGGVASISVGNILGGAMSVADGAAGVVSRHTQVTGTYSGNIGQVTNPKCFLEISRPQWVNVDEFNVDEPYKNGVGLPEIVKGTIASNNLINHLSVSWVDLTNLTAATPEELAEIESLLKSGILIKE